MAGESLYHSVTVMVESGGLQEALFDEKPGPSGGAYTNIRRASPLTDRWQISDYIFLKSENLIFSSDFLKSGD